MALKDIKKSPWQRQMHLAGAGLRAGLGWAGGTLRTWGMPVNQREEAREMVVREQAEAWVRKLGELKGSIVKIGQIVATYGDYCLPLPLAEALHQLEADTEPLAWSQISLQIAEALGRKREGLIIEPTPLAAASLSQVHRARIKRDHRSICLKILYPGIAETMDSDLAALQTGLRWWLSAEEQQRLVQWLGDIRTVLMDEIDLVQEAQKLCRWKDRLANDDRFAVPGVVNDFCGPGLLAMDYEAGVVVHDVSVAALSQVRRNALAEAMLELLLREILQWGEMQTDPHPGNYRIRIDKSDRGEDCLVLLDFGSVRYIAPSLLIPLQKMLWSAYCDDRDALVEAIFAAGLLDKKSTTDVRDAFADVLLALIEPLNYRKRQRNGRSDIPEYAVDADGNYCWAKANLPKRAGKQALTSAFSQHFVFPGTDFLLLSRKLAGVYAFIAALDARFDASVVFERVVADMKH